MTIKEIIECKKTLIRKRPPKLKLVNRDNRANLELLCDSEGLSLEMYIRKHRSFIENFSIGLILKTPHPFNDIPIVIYRHQGPGYQSISKTTEDIHNNYHIHYYSEEDCLYHRGKAHYKCEGNFSSYEEALISFLQACNIIDPNDIFKAERERLSQVNIDDIITDEV
jgi:hypothetical protein